MLPCKSLTNPPLSPLQIVLIFFARSSSASSSGRPSLCQVVLLFVRSSSPSSQTHEICRLLLQIIPQPQSRRSSSFRPGNHRPPSFPFLPTGEFDLCYQQDLRFLLLLANSLEFDFFLQNLRNSISSCKRMLNHFLHSKKATEVPVESTKKKFPHGSRRNKRQVNPDLLKMTEDELEMHMHNVPMKELIRLVEHRERLLKKDVSTSGTPTRNQSFSNNYEAFAQGTSSAYEDDYYYSMEAENATYYNYRTHMNITPRIKWSKQDTELFYEAIQQFGTDLSMIKECFPGRTREQIKAKYKKEERHQPLRLSDALTTRSKGHSQFEVVIERLKQAQVEDSENDDPTNLMIGEEEDEDAGLDATKPVVELQKEMESDTKFEDSEEDEMYWSQYKSEI